ncbi:UNC5C-like protein [Mya arenaria]|nr:UNC5C-like protein [Mya arenaria]
MDTFGTIAGFAVLGVGLCLCAIAIIWLCLKLRQHERDIIELLGKVPGQSNNKRYEGSYDDSAIDVNEVDARVRPLSRTSGVSFQDQANKRLSLTIHRERVNVYGKQPQMGLLLMTAQSYYKAQTKTSVDVPVEAIEVTNKATNRKTVMSQLLTDDWREGIPTSLLINGSSASFEDIFSHNKGIFIHRTVGKNGMTLEISGIKLEIPEGALEEDTLVTLGMVWDEKIVPKLTKKQTILSPLVLCQPSGLQFKKPVKLTFPHAARKVKTDWLPKILKRDGNLNESSEWEPVTLSDYEERQIGGHSICLQLYHFTLYTMVGESQPGKIAAKLVHFVAFTNQLQKGMYFKPRIYCLNSYKDEIGEVKELDQHLDHTSKVSDTSELIMHDNERDILVEVIKLCETWTLAGDRTEMLPFENVWHGFHPHCTFVMKPKKSTVVEIICELHAHQAGDDNRYAKLKLAESLPSPSSPLTPTEEDPLEDLTRELIILLDPANSLHSDAGDWRALAEKMDCSMSRLRWLGAQSSPTRLLMEKWTEGKKPLLELMQILLDINRPDAAEEVKKRLPILDSHSSDT